MSSRVFSEKFVLAVNTEFCEELVSGTPFSSLLLCTVCTYVEGNIYIFLYEVSIHICVALFIYHAFLIVFSFPFCPYIFLDLNHSTP